MSLREDFEVERMNDRDLYHGGPDGSQRPEAGISDPKDIPWCAGCWWCSPDFDHWANLHRRAS